MSLLAWLLVSFLIAYISIEREWRLPDLRRLFIVFSVLAISLFAVNLLAFQAMHAEAGSDELGAIEKGRPVVVGFRPEANASYSSSTLGHTHSLKPALYWLFNSFTDADAIDLAYVAMHGDNALFHLPSGVLIHPSDGGTIDSNSGENVYLSDCEWGDTDLEWMFTRTCSTLNENTISDVYFTFDDHLHGITGYHTETPQSQTFGREFAENLTNSTSPKTVKDAWFNCNRRFQDENVWAAIYRAVLWYYPNNEICFDYGDEYLPGYGSGENIDPGYFGYHGEDYYYLKAYHRVRCTAWGEVVGWY